MPMWMSDKEWKNPPFSRQCYRPSEVMGAIARVQLAKLGDILSHTRRLKKAFLAELGAPKGYTPQYVDDPIGECGISAAIIIEDPNLVPKYAEALKAEGRKRWYSLQRRISGSPHLSLLEFHSVQTQPARVKLSMERPEIQWKCRVFTGHVPANPFDS